MAGKCDPIERSCLHHQIFEGKWGY